MSKQNNFVEMPDIFKIHNASTDACDMLVGPCSCGAWHKKDEWILTRVMLSGNNISVGGS